MSAGPSPSPAPGDDELFRDGGGNGRLMAAFDWSATPVGPVGSWPASLRHAVRTVLVSRFPMILAWGPGYTQFYNDAYATLIGTKHPGAIGDDLRVTLAEGWAALQEPVEHAMAAREASWIPQLLLLLERAGYREETYFTVSHAPAYGDDGRVAGMHAVCTEVTRQVLAERRQRLLHDVASSTGELADETATVTAMTAALAGDLLDAPFAAVYLDTPGTPGLRRAATIGCDPGLLPEVAASPGELLPSAVAALGLTGGPFGDPVTEAAVLPLGAPDGDGVGALVVGLNPNRALDEEYRSFHELLAGQLTAAVRNARAYAEERARAEALAELDQAKTAFFANVSHELRTPLTLLLGPIADTLAADGPALPGDVRESLTLALRNGQRLQRLVNDLLEFVSIEAGRASAVRVQTDVAAYTAELAGVLRAAAERAGLRLTVDCPPLGRPAYVDPRMWEKVVLNLVANAVKYTFVGGIDVVLRADGDDLVLRVSDTGVGIPADELPRLFERFHRGVGTAARSREGSGLGLALVRELVALHGGEVRASSEPGAGSTFTVRVPFGEPDAPAGAPAVPSASSRGGVVTPWDDVADGAGPRTPASSPGTSVLVVDDNADMRAYLTRLLSPIWSVRTAANGQEALDAVRAARPDVVVTDVMMPGLDGFDLLRALRADPALRGVPVVMLTARAGQEAAVEGFDAGVDDYLAKPFESAELIGRLRAVVERAAGRATGARPADRGAELPAGPAAADGDEAPSVPPRPRPPMTPAAAAPAAGDRAAQPGSGAPARTAVRRHWRFPATTSSVPALRRRLWAVFADAGLDEDLAYDLVLAACEAATNAIEHAQDPTEPAIDVRAEVAGGRVEVAVRDYGRWRERVPSMDRGRGSMLMSVAGDVTATPSPAGTTVVIRAGGPPLPSDRALG
ncbi:ATP-binding protein [Geodermatophilus poikilotrophus]|uniref:histidine kinase n=1 Tax=Geodermatophilus poikilotrophus TaxID=1333667 RepID=A0A1I0HRF6_9ACTN|nr:ATP-binding protein [Geodermatophilus poikilotrophus]SET86607.1 Signal transduction histidine kinase [Geodermatophilus poikilotrophus]